MGINFYEKIIKRIIDIGGAMCGLIILSPLMFFVAALIRFDSKGPAIFKSPRVGRYKNVFNCYKFRTMVIDAPCAVATRKIDADRYITRIGRIIRKLSLDEIPQLFNILKGEMSFIGYRPVVVTEKELNFYRDARNIFIHRPGLTGLAQISGRDNLIDMDIKAKIDGAYCNNITFFNDCSIFFATIAYVLGKKDIVEGKIDTVTKFEPPVIKKQEVIIIAPNKKDSSVIAYDEALDNEKDIGA